MDVLIRMDISGVLHNIDVHHFTSFALIGDTELSTGFITLMSVMCKDECLHTR